MVKMKTVIIEIWGVNMNYKYTAKPKTNHFAHGGHVHNLMEKAYPQHHGFGDMVRNLGTSISNGARSLYNKTPFGNALLHGLKPGTSSGLSGDYSGQGGYVPLAKPDSGNSFDKFWSNPGNAYKYTTNATSAIPTPAPVGKPRNYTFNAPSIPEYNADIAKYHSGATGGRYANRSTTPSAAANEHPSVYSLPVQNQRAPLSDLALPEARPVHTNIANDSTRLRVRNPNALSMPSKLLPNHRFSNGTANGFNLDPAPTPFSPYLSAASRNAADLSGAQVYNPDKYKKNIAHGGYVTPDSFFRQIQNHVPAQHHAIGEMIEEFIPGSEKRKDYVQNTITNYYGKGTTNLLKNTAAPVLDYLAPDTNSTNSTVNPIIEDWNPIRTGKNAYRYLTDVYDDNQTSFPVMAGLDYAADLLSGYPAQFIGKKIKNAVGWEDEQPTLLGYAKKHVPKYITKKIFDVGKSAIDYLAPDTNHTNSTSTSWNPVRMGKNAYNTAAEYANDFYDTLSPPAQHILDLGSEAIFKAPQAGMSYSVDKFGKYALDRGKVTFTAGLERARRGAEQAGDTVLDAGRAVGQNIAHNIRRGAEYTGNTALNAVRAGARYAGDTRVVRLFNELARRFGRRHVGAVGGLHGPEHIV